MFEICIRPAPVPEPSKSLETQSPARTYSLVEPRIPSLVRVADLVCTYRLAWLSWLATWGCRSPIRRLLCPRSRSVCRFCGSSRCSTTSMRMSLPCGPFLARHRPTLHLGQVALAGSAVLMEIPIAMIVASRLLPVRANRLANIIAGTLVTLVNGFLTFIPPLVGWGRPPALPEYLFFATVETVATVAIVWQAWTWRGADAEVAPKLLVGQP